MNIQLERIHKHLTSLGKLLHEYPDTSDDWDDTERTREFKDDYKTGTQRLREDFDQYLNGWLEELNYQFGEVEDDE